MKMLLAVPALALFSAPALARPEMPLKPDVQLRASSDGRADLHVDHASRPSADAYSAERARPAADNSYGRGSHFQAPLKAEAAMKLQNGDNREGSTQKQAAATPADQSAPGASSKFVPPLKTSIALRLQNGDNREGSGAAKSAAAAKDAGERSAKPLSRDQKELLCRQTGVCLPTLSATADEDKTE